MTLGYGNIITIQNAIRRRTYSVSGICAVELLSVDFALILSVVVLLAAPLLSKLLAGRQVVQAGMDGFVMVSIIGLVCMNLLPEALFAGGSITMLVALLGLFLPWIAEFIVHKSEAMMHRALILIAVFALILHAASDGAILAAVDSTPSGDFVAAGIIIHRVGVGLAVWWLLSPILQSTMSYILLGALGVMTIIGYLLFDLAVSWYGLPLIGYWQAFAAGSLLHVILHPVGEHAAPGGTASRNAHRIGTAIGTAFVATVVVTHFASHTDGAAAVHMNNHVADMLYDMGVAGALPLLGILLIAGLVGYLRHNSMQAMMDHIKALLPWSVLLWLMLTYGAMLQWYSLALFSENMPEIFFWLWAVIIGYGLFKIGAREFFAPLLPARLTSHDHHSATSVIHRED